MSPVRIPVPFDQQCRAYGLPEPTAEHRFHPTRRWRFDWAWPAYKIAVEIEGGVFAGGRHSRGAGYRNDLEKYNSAHLMGWRVFRYLPEQVRDGQAVHDMTYAVKQAAIR